LVHAIWNGGELATPTRRTVANHLEEVTTMIDYRAAKMLGHRRNIERYCRLLATELTDLERQYHKRIAEEHAQLERLEKSQPEPQTELIAAADVLGKRTGGQSHV
jgi:hypothetical protein